MKTIITLFLLAFCASVQARIGETVAECVARYGKPVAVSESGLTFTFKSKGFEIEITFFNGKCEVIEYARWVPGVLTEKYSEAFSEVEQKLPLQMAHDDPR